jgi:hypothetical protein
LHQTWKTYLPHRYSHIDLFFCHLTTASIIEQKECNKRRQCVKHQKGKIHILEMMIGLILMIIV